MNKKTIRDVDVSGKRVLVRVDFNVPIDNSGNIENDLRIRATVPTINYLCEHGAKTVLISHLGRPKKREPHLKMDSVSRRLSEILGKPVKKIDECIGDSVLRNIEEMNNGDILMLENIRFHPEETKNDDAFAKALARNGDIFVCDSFATAHRVHASTVGIAKYIEGYAGFLLEREINYLGMIAKNPKHPFTVVVGGAKVSDKLGLVEKFIGKASQVCIGGGMAYTFLKARGLKTGNSIIEIDRIKDAERLFKEAEKHGIDIELPVDVVVTEKLEDTAPHKIVPVEEIPNGSLGADIGPETVRIFSRIIKNSATVFWNGPMGVYEIPIFSVGTRGVADAMAACSGVTVCGGGDIGAALEKMGYAGRISHISTGGGASLEFLAGKELPGISVLSDK